MQTNTKVEKIGKKFKQDTHYQEVPVLGKGKKFNKPKRGGGVKGAFRNSKEESKLNQAKYLEY